ncbi:MAG: DUF4912 domain-containing protein [Microcystaceae cyanobacterium]
MIKTKLSIALLASVLTWGFVPNGANLRPIEQILAQDASPSPEETVSPSPDVEVTPSPEETVSPSPDAEVTPSPEATTETTIVEEEEPAGFPWWIFLIPLLAILGFFLLRSGDSADSEAEEETPPPSSTDETSAETDASPEITTPPVTEAENIEPIPPSRLVLTARSCTEAYAYWEVPEAKKAEIKAQGGENILLRVYDVTGIDIEQQDPHSTAEYYFIESAVDYNVPIAQDDRDYIAELGYLTADNRFLTITRSLPVHIPPCPPEPPVTPETEEIPEPLPSLPVESPVSETIEPESEVIPDSETDNPPSRIILTARSCTEAYAYWEVPEAKKAEIKAQGGENMILRIYDVTDIDIEQQEPHSTAVYDVAESAVDYDIPITQDNRDYVAELGYLTTDNQFLTLVRSFHTRIPPCPPEEASGEAMFPPVPPLPIPPETEEEDEILNIFEDESLFSSPEAEETTETLNFIHLVCRSADEAYVSWQVSEEDKANLQQKGGETLILRLYDLTDANADGQPDTMWDHECAETDNERVIPLYQGDRNYMAELGYRTSEGRWLSLVQSEAVYVPPKSSQEA